MDPVPVYRRLLKTTLTMRRAVRKLLGRHGLTGAQYGVLTRIPEEGISLTQLAETAWTDPGNTSGIVDRLVREGWVTRTRSNKDRRVVYVSLSDSGKRLLETLSPLYRQTVVSMMAGLSDEHLHLLDDLLARLEPAAEAALEEMGEDDEPAEEETAKGVV